MSETALVIEIRGPQGSGKSRLARMIEEMLEHAMISASIEDEAPYGLAAALEEVGAVLIRVMQTPEPKPTAPQHVFSVRAGK